MQNQLGHAAIWRRAIALAIDCILILNVFIYPVGMLFRTARNHFFKGHELYSNYPDVFLMLPWIQVSIGFIIWITYFAVFEHSSLRATPGKMVIKLKVFYLENDSIVLASILRNLIKVSPIILFQSYGIHIATEQFLSETNGYGRLPPENTSFVSWLILIYVAFLYSPALFNKQKQTIHDLMAKTIVVKTDDNPLKRLYLKIANFIKHLRKANFSDK